MRYMVNVDFCIDGTEKFDETIGKYESKESATEFFLSERQNFLDIIRKADFWTIFSDRIDCFDAGDREDYENNHITMSLSHTI